MGDKTIVFGVGTGRCGTTSLAQLLDQQEGVSVTHERFGPVPWGGGGRRKFVQLIRDLKSEPSQIYGDVASYWLPHMREFIDESSAGGYRARVIVLQRNRASTVKSFVRKTYGRNPWRKHRGILWEESPWDVAFPKFDVITKSKAVGRYWDLYYEKANELKREYPEQVMFVEMKDLNNYQTCADVLKFVGVNPGEWRIQKVRANKKSDINVWRRFRMVGARWKKVARRFWEYIVQ